MRHQLQIWPPPPAALRMTAVPSPNRFFMYVGESQCGEGGFGWGLLTATDWKIVKMAQANPGWYLVLGGHDTETPPHPRARAKKQHIFPQCWGGGGFCAWERARDLRLEGGGGVVSDKIMMGLTIARLWEMRGGSVRERGGEGGSEEVLCAVWVVGPLGNAGF